MNESLEAKDVLRAGIIAVAGFVVGRLLEWGGKKILNRKKDQLAQPQPQPAQKTA